MLMDFTRGDTTGLRIPAHAEALRAVGEDFLTEAFRHFGSLSPDNAVQRITRFENCPGGSTGQKLLLSVEYLQPEPGLHTDLFVKFSRDFSDPVRDNRGKYEMEGEVRFAEISRLPGFPINVPAAYFADYHHESHTGLLITQKITYGVNGIEPHRPKCMDHEISEPLVYYREIIKALARIAAAHKSGRLSRDIATQFPFDAKVAAAADPIPFDAQQLKDYVAQYADFVVRCRHLMPANITAPAFIARLDREIQSFLEHEAEIKLFLQSNPDLIALCHWNANIDNNWFWRDASGAICCGLIDWGRVGQMNLAFSIWGSLSGAPLELWDHHLQELLTLFTTELALHGGPKLDIAELHLHLMLYIALMAVSYFIASPSRILLRLPEVARAADVRDPVFKTNETARNQLHMCAIAMNLWDRHDFGALLKDLLAR